MRIGGLLQNDAVRRRQMRPAPTSSACAATPIVQPQPGHDADALRLDENLAFGAVLRADFCAKMIVGAQEPLPVPTCGPGGGAFLARRHGKRCASSSRPRCSAMAIISWAASTNNPAIKTDSATLPSLLVVVWKDCPGSSEKVFRFRQSFQSARPISGSHAARAESSVYCMLRRRCS